MMRTLVFFCLLPLLALAQNYYEATGQTQAFTLTAGARAVWNPGILTEKTGTLPVVSVFRITALGNGLFVQAGTKGTLKFYDIRGRRAASLKVERDGYMPLSHTLANGIYAVRFEADGLMSKTAKLAVVR